MSQTKAQLIAADATFTISSDATINSITVGKGANSVTGNTVLGENALDAAVTGANNTAIGKNALTENTSGNQKVVMRTVAGGGYHQWHYEDGQFLYRDRVLAWMIYLNTIPTDNGGGTDFLHQKLTLQPTEGTIVLWPASYTHVHRGGFLTGEIPKFIATGWFIREPGQAIREVL